MSARLFIIIIHAREVFILIIQKLAITVLSVLLFALASPTHASGFLTPRRTTLGSTKNPAAAKTLSANRKPNIVFIVADDLGMQDVGFMGSKYFETPHLDALSADSMVFDQAYMYPTCSPSRAAILTGQQSFRTGMLQCTGARER